MTITELQQIVKVLYEAYGKTVIGGDTIDGTSEEKMERLKEARKLLGLSNE